MSADRDPTRDRDYVHVRDHARDLDDALEALYHGKSLPSDHSSDAAETGRLRRMLETAQAILAVPNPEPPSGTMVESKARMMRLLAEKKAADARHKEAVIEDLGMGFRKAHGRGVILTILLIVFSFILASTFVVSALQALPGSWLYPAKLTLQEIHIGLTFDPSLRGEWIARYHQTRLEDLQKAVALDRFPQTDAQATMTAMPTLMPVDNNQNGSQ